MFNDKLAVQVRDVFWVTYIMILIGQVIFLEGVSRTSYFKKKKDNSTAVAGCHSGLSGVLSKEESCNYILRVYRNLDGRLVASWFFFDYSHKRSLDSTLE